MAKVLYIKANPKPDDMSNTFQLADEFLNEYKKLNPEDEITELDLYNENIRFIDNELLGKMFSGEGNNIMLEHATRFAEYDKYVVAAPMWNLSIPAILKAYFDYVSYVGVTFKYTAEGPVGLLADKHRKVMHVVTRGGYYSDGPAKEFELGDKYVRTIFNFYGVHDIETLKLELTNVLQGEDLANAKKAAYEDARRFAQSF